MQTKPLPQGYQTVMPYLILKDALKFYEFTQTVFEAQELRRTLREDGVTLMHGEVSIGGSAIMFAESSPDFGDQNAGLFVYVDDCDKRYQLALDNGATIIMPPVDQDYGRGSGVIDPFGNTWWITSLL